MFEAREDARGALIVNRREIFIQTGVRDATRNGVARLTRSDETVGEWPAGASENP